jgi:predicted dehydrogenase
LDQVIYDIVGCGAVVRTYHVPVLRSLARTAPVAVAGCFDLDRASAAAVAQLLGAGRHAGGDWTPSPAAEAALVATPPGTHGDIARRYLAAGKHVFVEKPFVGSAEEARRLLQQARDVDRRILVAHFRRFYPSLQTARRFLAAGGLGRIRRVEATEGARWEWPARSSYFLRDPYGGVVWDTGAHLVDMLLYALSLDEPGRALECHTRERVQRPAREPAHDYRAVLDLTLDGGAGVEVRLALSRLEPLAGALKLYGEAGVLVIPTSFALAPTLFRGAERFELKGVAPDLAPSDALGCFVLEHLAFLAACAGHAPSVLDADRFVGLTGLLAQLSAAGAGA